MSAWLFDLRVFSSEKVYNDLFAVSVVSRNHTEPVQSGRLPIPTRRVKSISKLFCIEDLIRRGFI